VSARPGGPAIRPQPRCRREGRSLSRSVFRAASGREGSDEIGIRVAGHGPQPEQGRVRHLGHLPAREGAEAQHGERGALSAAKPRPARCAHVGRSPSCVRPARLPGPVASAVRAKI
jgi:hypothetical protein